MVGTVCRERWRNVNANRLGLVSSLEVELPRSQDASR
jgi:hypothetical protein